MNEKEIEKYLEELSSGWKWEKNPDKITKEFKFKDFEEALSFTNAVGEIAEKEGHHPNIYIHSYNKVKIELWTHKIGGLHENDFILAAKIEELN